MCVCLYTVSYADTESTQGTTTYNVDITWGDLTYLYDMEKVHWDPEQHKYVDNGTGVWTEKTPGSSGKINVKNSSNVDIKVGAAFDVQNSTDYGNITGSFYIKKDGYYIEKGTSLKERIEEGTLATPTERTIVLKLKGKPNVYGKTIDTLGTVTITIDSEERSAKLLSKSKMTLKYGETDRLTISNSEGSTVTWSSTNGDIVTVDGNNKYGAPQHDAIETCNQNLANQIEMAFRSLYSKNAAEAQRVIDEIMGQDSGIKVIADEQGNFIKLEFYGFKRNSLNLDSSGSTKPEGTTQESEVGFENNKFRMPVNAYSLVRLSKCLQQKLEQNYQTALNGKTLDDYSAEVKSAYQMAYGAKNAQDMANAFAQSQQEGVQNTKAVVQGLGMVAMVAGQLIPVGGQVATALVMGGMATSTFGSVGVSAVENYTKAGGPTEEDKKEILEEVNPRKWICVGVEEDKVIVDSIGDLVILIMDNNYPETLHENFKNLK